MKNIIKVAVFTLASTFGLQAMATEPVVEQVSVKEEVPLKLATKNFTIGFGIQKFDADNIDASGTSFSFSYAIDDWWAFRFSHYSVDADTFESYTGEEYKFDWKGFDYSLLWGRGFQAKGFKYYGGVGYYNDDLASGAQLSAGLGYNWESVSLDFLVGARNGDNYQDEYETRGFGLNIDVAYMSSLTLSGRF